MLTSIQGIYRKGKVILNNIPLEMAEDTPVIVTFIGTNPIELKEHNISETQASDLLGRLAAFAEEWNSPEMNVYNNYDEEKEKRNTLIL